MTDEELHNLLAEAAPGPWEYDPDDAISHDVYGTFAGHKFHICFATGGFNKAGIAEANARLIAAAPDLAAEVLRLREVERAAEHLADAVFQMRLGPVGVSNQANDALVAYRVAKESVSSGSAK